MTHFFVALAISIGAGCDRREKSGPGASDPGSSSASGRPFYCEKTAKIPLRTCGTAASHCEARGCFVRPTAHCYSRSAFEAGGWSNTNTVTSCFPSAAECMKDHDSEGPIGPPPVQGPCRETRADEL